MKDEYKNNKRNKANQLLQIESLLQCVQTLYNSEKLEEEKKHANGDYYNIFSTLGLTSNEVRLHSAFIAELLNPKGAHGLGSKPLELFLSVIDDREKREDKCKSAGCEGTSDNGENNDKWEFDALSSNVILEYFIGKISKKGDTGGQIDILIVDKNNNAIIIENKIYACDQPKQLLRYQNYANLHHKDNYSLLYLTLYGDCPSDVSTCNSVEYHCISYYDHITSWLNSCLEISQDKPLINAVIKQYLTTLDFLMDRHSDKYQDKLTSILLKEENIDSVLEIIENGDKVRNKIREDFIHQLKEMAEEEGFTMGYSEGIVNQYERDQWIWFNLPVSDKWAFFIGQDNPGKNIVYGISLFLSGTKGLYKYQYNQLEHIWQENPKNDQFPMGSNFMGSTANKTCEGPWRNWNNTTTLRDMRNGKMLEYIRAQLRKVKEQKLVETIVELEKEGKESK